MKALFEFLARLFGRKPATAPAPEVAVRPQTPRKPDEPMVFGRFPASGMTLSPVGARLIREREGCILHAYQDSVGVWTIGVGHTGRDVFPGRTITQEEADELLIQDARIHAEPVNRLVLVLISQNEFDAMCSFTFNVGAGGFARSSVLNRLNQGDRASAAESFMLWNKPPEIISRRKGEYEQFRGRRFVARA